MERTIKIGDKSVKLSNNIGWTLNYREQFGQDIVPTVMPILASLMDLIVALVGESKNSEIGIDDIVELANDGELTNVITHLYGLEFVDFINITWSMAKCADNDIDEPKEWLKQFESFPLDEVAPAVLKLIAKGVISSKNLKRLRKTMTILQPFKQMTSSSQE